MATKGPRARGMFWDAANNRLDYYIGETKVGYISSTGQYVSTASIVETGKLSDATATVTQSASGTFAVVVQLLDGVGTALAEVASCRYYLSKNSDGSTVATTSTDVTTLAQGTDGLVREDNVDGNVWGELTSEDDGDVDLDIVVPASKTVYLVLIMPSGELVISDAMTYGM